MNKRVWRIRHEQGNVTIIALIILVVLTLIGISASRTSNMDMQIARNQIPFKQNFYIAEGGQNREAVEIGGGSYPVLDIDAIPTELADQDSPGLPGGDHLVLGEDYDFTVDYVGYYPAPAGYSIIYFSRYDYTVFTNGNVEDSGNGVSIDARYFRIGPKAE
jgi:hypothetical protein